MCPFLEGLGMPASIRWAACPIVDAMKTTLRISCPAEGTLEIVDKTAFGRNVTRVPTDGTEEERLTKGRGKKFMLSAETTDQFLSVNCRLISRGPGWHTRSERRLADDGASLIETHVLVRPGSEDVVINRHFVRGSDEDLRPVTS